MEKAYVAAIDFGTTYSAYAFCCTANPHEHVTMNVNWGSEIGQQSYKCPTSVLVDKNGTFKAFGYKAEKLYAEDCANYELYKNFKMMLHKNKDLSIHSKIHSVRNKPKMAIDIFAMALRYMKGHLLDAIHKTKVINIDILSEMIKWVITVPAIWEDKAKKFMREAAYKADLVNSSEPENLLLVLEPEAASRFCQFHFQPGPGSSNMQPGQQYIIVDAGGGTVDTSAHRILVDGNLVELIPASGGEWGGNEVNKLFERSLEDIFGKDFITALKHKYPIEWTNIINAFENFKRCSGKFLLQLSYNLIKFFHEIKNIEIEKYLEKRKIDFRNGSIIFAEEKLRSFSEPVIKLICEHLSLLLQNKMLNIDFVLLCGGFGQSKHLFEKVKEICDDCNVEVKCPSEGITAVVVGAIYFAQNPSCIVERVMQRTYGYGVSKPFQEGVHDEERAFIHKEDGTKRCDDLFKIIVKRGDSIKFNETKHSSYTPLYSDASTTFITIYSTENDSVTYTDEDGVNRVGTLELQIPIIPGKSQRDRDINVQFYFGQTELQVKVSDSEGMSEPVEINFNYWENE